MRKPIIGVTVGTPIRPSAVIEKADVLKDYLKTDDLEQAIKDALEQAKASGDFDGATPTIKISDDGYWVINGTKTEHKAKGENGDGYVLTPEDMEYIASLVTPSGGGGSDHTPDGKTLITDGGKTSVHGIYPKLIDRDDPTITKDTTINNTPIGFFVGTQEAYDNLKPEEQANLFALIQDEDDAIAFEDLKKASYTEGLEYTLNDDKQGYHCWGRGSVDNPYIKIPPYHNGLPVTEITEIAFKGTNIRSIVIPDTVTTLSKNAFKGCGELASVIFGRGLIDVGYSAFEGCISLTDVMLPENCESLGRYAFYGCTSLRRIFIPKSVNSVSANTFINCPNLIIYLEKDIDTSKWDEGWNWNCRIINDVSTPSTQTTIHAVAADHATSATLLDRATLINGTFDAQGKTVTLPEDIEMGVYVAEARVVTPNTGTDGVISSALVLFNPSQDSYFTLTTPVMVLVCRMHVYPGADKTEISVTGHLGEAQAYTINFFRLRRII